MSSQKCLFSWGSGAHLIHVFLDPHKSAPKQHCDRFSHVNGHDQHTDSPCHSVAMGHICTMHVMQPKNYQHISCLTMMITILFILSYESNLYQVSHMVVSTTKWPTSVATLWLHFAGLQAATKAALCINDLTGTAESQLYDCEPVSSAIRNALQQRTGCSNCCLLSDLSLSVSSAAEVQ